MKKYFLKTLLLFYFFFFLDSQSNFLIADSKIYLDLAKIEFQHNPNYKSYEISSQLPLKTHMDKEIERWAKSKFILKGDTGILKIQIEEEKIFDNFVKEHAEKFTFIPKEGISYKIFFQVKLTAENTKHNAFAKIVSKVNGDRTFLGTFSINDRSKAVDELLKSMILRLQKNIEVEVNKQFKDFLANKYR